MAVLNVFLERLPLDVFHRDEMRSPVGARGIHLDEVGMIELGGRRSFAVEPRDEGGIGGEMRRKQFQRDDTVELRIVGFINRAHAAFAEFAEDDKTADAGCFGMGWFEAGHRGVIGSRPVVVVHPPSRRHCSGQGGGIKPERRPTLMCNFDFRCRSACGREYCWHDGSYRRTCDFRLAVTLALQLIFGGDCV